MTVCALTKSCYLRAIAASCHRTPATLATADRREKYAAARRLRTCAQPFAILRTRDELDYVARDGSERRPHAVERRAHDAEGPGIQGDRCDLPSRGVNRGDIIV